MSQNGSPAIVAHATGSRVRRRGPRHTGNVGHEYSSIDVRQSELSPTSLILRPAVAPPLGDSPADTCRCAPLLRARGRSAVGDHLPECYEVWTLMGWAARSRGRHQAGVDRAVARAASLSAAPGRDPPGRRQRDRALRLRRPGTGSDRPDPRLPWTAAARSLAIGLGSGSPTRRYLLGASSPRGGSLAATQSFAPQLPRLRPESQPGRTPCRWCGAALQRAGARARSLARCARRDRCAARSARAGPATSAKYCGGLDGMAHAGAAGAEVPVGLLEDRDLTRTCRP
jgi:hypothetical protein